MLEILTERLNGVFSKLGRRGRLGEADVDAALREVRMALLEADVNFRVARDFVAAVRERAVGREVIESITPAQQVIKILNDHLVELLGSETSRIATAPRPPTIVLLVGLQGSGKTTTAAKLALAFKRDGGRPLLVAADTQRPAAIEQLKTLGKQIDVPVHVGDTKHSPIQISTRGRELGIDNAHSHVVVDTAGRIQLDEPLMDEIGQISRAIDPTETLFVADATTGQEAVNAAKEFHAQSPLNGLILTKMDGDARGGAALSIRSVTGVPIKFIATGEQIEPLEVFHPDRIASRILGMGDVVTLVERAEETIDQERAIELEEKIRKASFGLDDFLEQLNQVKKMGPLSQVFGMLPGMSSMTKNADVQAALDGDGLRHFEAIILSMTPNERRNPDQITGSRRRRIAAGSGTSVQDVNQLLNQFKQARKMMQMMSSGKMPTGLRNMMGL